MGDIKIMVRYPAGIKRKNKTAAPTSYANRGAALEQLIERVNIQVYTKGWGLIQKVPTPVTIIKKQGGRVVDGFVSKSTVDFIGHYKGRPVAFDAKQTKNKTSFPLKYVEDHQVSFLKNWHDTGGAAFLIVEFTTLQKYFFLPFPVLWEHWKEKERGGRKSIKLENFTIEVTPGRGLVLDYLQPLESLEK
jgi:recombination protein U